MDSLGRKFAKDSSGKFLPLKKVQEFGDQIDNTSEKIGAMESALAAIGSAAIVGGIVNAGSSIVKMAATFEKYETVLTTTLGTQKKAQEAMQMIQKVAASTPFAVTELTESFIKLANRGLKPAMSDFIKFGDIAASQGKSFDQFTEAVLDATSGEFERLKEFGIKGSKEGERVTLSFKGAIKEISNTPEAIKEALLAFGELEGVMGGMEAISGTTEGKFSNMGDAVDALKKTLGDVLLPTVKSVTIGLIKLVEIITDFAKANPALTKTILQVSAGVAALLAIMAGTAGLNAMITALIPLTVKLGISFNAMLGPVGWVTAGIIGMVAAFNALEDSAKKAQAAANSAFTNRMLASGTPEIASTISVLGGKDTQKGKDNLTYFLKQLRTQIQNGKNDINALNASAQAAASVGLKALGDEIKINGHNITRSIDAIDVYLDRVKDFQPAAKNASAAFGSMGKAAKNSGILIVDAMKEISSEMKAGRFGESEMTIKLNPKMDKNNLERIKANLERLGVQVRDVGLKNEIQIKIDNRVAKEKVQEVEDELLKLNKEAKNYKIQDSGGNEKTDFWTEWEQGTGALNEYEQAAKNAQAQYEKLQSAIESGDIAKIIGSGAKMATELLKSLGQAFLNLLQSQTQLKLVGIQNMSQYATAYSDYQRGLWDREDKEFAKMQESELKAVEEKIRAIEEEEQSHLDRLERMRSDFDEKEKSRIDALYQEEADKLKDKYNKQIELLMATITDQVQLEAMSAIAREDYQNQLQDKRTEYDEMYKENVAANSEEINTKQEEVSQNAILLKEEEEKKKAQLEEQAKAREEMNEKRRAELKQKAAAVEYALQLGAFYANKQMQLASAKMQMAMMMLNAVAGLASSFAQGGPAGFILGLGIMVPLIAMGVQAGMNSMAAINSAQPPPPPAAALGFAQGGIVEGGVQGRDSVPAFLMPGELVTPKQNFDEVVNSVARTRNGETAVNLTINNSFSGVDSESSIVDKITTQVISTIKYGTPSYTY